MLHVEFIPRGTDLVWICKNNLNQTAKCWVVPLILCLSVSCISFESAGLRKQTAGSQGSPLNAVEHEAIVKALAAKYPGAHYLSTWASGPTTIEALNQAKSEIAGRINSEITATSQSHRSMKTGPAAAVQSDSELTIDISSTSTFKHGELISEVLQSRHSFEGNTFVFAALKKSEIGDILLREYEQAAQPFRITCGRITAASASHDRQAICRERKGFEAQPPTVLNLANQWFAIFKRYPDNFTRDDQCIQRATGRLAEASVPRFLTLDAAAVSGGVQEPLIEAIRRYSAKISFSVAEGRSCTSGLLLRLRGKVGCSPGQLGSVCQMTAVGEMVDCASPSRSLGNVNLGRVTGVSMSDDSAAMSRLVKNIRELSFTALAKRLEEEVAPCSPAERTPANAVAH